MQTFHATIAAFDRTLYDGEALHCRIRTATGSLGLGARHEPLLAALLPDSKVELRTPDGKVTEFAVRRGLLSFLDNTCTVLLRPGTD